MIMTAARHAQIQPAPARSMESKGLYYGSDGILSLVESGWEPEDETGQIDYGYEAVSDRRVPKMRRKNLLGAMT